MAGPENGTAEIGTIPVPGEAELEAEGGCDVTLGIGILYRGAFGCTTRILRNCSGRGRHRQDYLLCLLGSFSDFAGEPSLEPKLRLLHARPLNSIGYKRLNCVFGLGTLEAL